MGAADVVPGVSGGTIALITHIYERLIRAIDKISFLLILHLFGKKRKEAWQVESVARQARRVLTYIKE